MDERERAVAAAVELNRRLSGPRVSPDLAGMLEVLVAAMPAVASRFTAAERQAFAEGHGDVDARGTHPVRGEHSPTAAQVRTTPDGLVVRFDVRHEGVPGHVHGSFVSGFFDVALGLVAIEQVGLGVTAELSVRFRRPVPLHHDVLYRGTVVRREGRSTFVEGAAVIEDGGQETEAATASIRFVHPKELREGAAVEEE
jgi:acyl-coenzyme A thioesterase PaaI-like protein